MVERWRLAAEGVGKMRPAPSRAIAVRAGYQTAFLSHSHSDKNLVLGLQAMLLEAGWKVYLDWQDEAMPEKPNAETAARIVERIKENQWFLMLATPESLKSLWCPWEVGIAHHVKNPERMFIVMTADTNGRLAGTEFYHVYNRITMPETLSELRWGRVGKPYQKLRLGYLNAN